MKKVLAITLLILCLAVTAMAVEGNWRLGVKTTADGTLGGGAGIMHYGTAATDFSIEAAPGADITGTTIWNVGVDDPFANKIWSKTWKPVNPSEYVFDIRVAALPLSAYTNIRLEVLTISGTLLPPGGDWAYKLVMVDNKGKAGAPANGFEWDLAVPTVHPTTLLAIDLPMLKLSSSTAQAFYNEGYAMQLVAFVPEPSSMLALGAGLMGLAGFVVRRRRS